MVKLKNFIYTHWKPIVLSAAGFIITVSLMALPHINILNLQESNLLDIVYTPNHVNGDSVHFDDQVKLAPAIQLARYGRLTGKLGNIERTSELYPNVLQESLVAFIYAPIIYLTGSVDSPYYILPFLVGLIYLIGFCLLRDWSADLLTSFCLPLTMIFGYSFLFLILPNGIFHPSDVLDSTSRISRWVDARAYELNSFYRIHTLGASYGFFLGFIYFFYKSLFNVANSKQYLIPLSIFLALQFYCYIFYALAASFSFILVLLWLVLSYIFSDRSEEGAQHILYLFFAGLVALLLSIPPILETLSLVTSNDSADWFGRLALNNGTAEVFRGNDVLLALILFFFFLCNDTRLKVIAISLLLTVLAIENSAQLIGVQLQPGHIYIRAVMPLIVLAIGCTLYVQFKKFDPVPLSGKQLPVFLYVYKLLLGVLTLYIVYIAYGYSYTYAQLTYKYQGLRPEQVDAYKWFEDHNETVVATLLPEIGMPLPIHTPAYLYLNFSGHLHQTATNKDIDSRLVNLLWLFDANEEQLLQYFAQEHGLPIERRYHYYYWQRRFGYPRYDLRLTEHVAKLNSSLAMYDVNSAHGLCKSPFDYLIVDEGHVRQKVFPELRKQYLIEEAKFGAISIYKLQYEALGCARNKR